MIDACCHASVPAAVPPGPHAALRRREGLPLALCGQGQGGGRERGVSREAQHPRRPACPGLPTRAPCQRPRRPQPRALVAGCRPLGPRLAAQPCGDDARDSAGGPTRHATRRGAGGRPGRAARGGRQRLGWDEGVHRRRAVTPVGASTGGGVGPARTPAQRLADPWFARRRSPPPAWPGAGAPPRGRLGWTRALTGAPGRPRGHRPRGPP
jgi:hypothetical protein